MPTTMYGVPRTRLTYRVSLKLTRPTHANFGLRNRKGAVKFAATEF